MARVFAAVVLTAVVIAIAADHAAIATMPAPKPGALAEPKSTHQTGFPDQLYKFSIPPDNPQTPAKIALGKALFPQTDPVPRQAETPKTLGFEMCHVKG